MTEDVIVQPVHEVPDDSRARIGLPTMLLRFVALLYVFLLVGAGLAVVGLRVGWGWQPYLVSSGSMVPAMQPGDVVLVEPHRAGQVFDEPTIVTFDDPVRGLVTHRIVRAERAADGEMAYTTKGDANRVAESDVVRQRDVVGSVRYVLRYGGMPVLWARTGHWGPLALWLAGTALAVWVAAGALGGLGRRSA